MREIEQGLGRGRQRDKFEIKSVLTVHYRDIYRSILDFKPQIVHFSGHGVGQDGLIFENGTGQAKLVDAAALARLFKLFKTSVNCVVLNACYSEIQAIAIALHIDYVIGMSQAVGDRSAIEFAVGFYDALGAGESIKFAYQLGCTLIQDQGISEELTPKLLEKQLLVQQTVRNYQVLRTLGQGGMGTVFLASDGTGNMSGHWQLLALKQLNADLAKMTMVQELFEREARTLRSLNHPGIPKYYDFFVEGGKQYLAMQLIHGQDLEKLIYQKGPVTPIQGITWMIQICKILDYLHSRNPPVIHKCITPAHLIVRNSDNCIVIVGFSNANQPNAYPGSRIGADGYFAPEQERGQALPQSDLYSIGVILIFLLTGEHPIRYYRQRGRNFRFDVTTVPTITPELREVIDRVTEPLPRDRYQTAKDLAAALASAFDDLSLLG